jgi:hypothetical protein
MVRNTGPVNEYESQSAIIPFVGIIIRKEYKLLQQCHFICISWRVATKKKERKQTLAGNKLCCFQFEASTGNKR